MSKSHQNWDDIVRQICLGTKFECVICKGSYEQLISPCLHVFCKNCIYESVYRKWKNVMIEKKMKGQDSGRRTKMK